MPQKNKDLLFHTIPAPTAFLGLSFCLIICILFSLLVSFQNKPEFWSMSYLRCFSRITRFEFAFFAIFWIFAFQKQQTVVTMATIWEWCLAFMNRHQLRRSSGLRQFGLWKHITILGYSSLALPIFWIFRTNIVYGDSYDIVWEVHHHAITMSYPLTSILLHLFYNMLKLLGFGPGISIQIFSCLCGVCYLYLLILLSQQLFIQRKCQIFFVIILSSIATVQTFFGFPDIYAAMAVGCLWYIFWSILYIKQRISFSLICLCYSIVILLNGSAITLFPSFLYLFFLRQKITGSQITRIIPGLLLFFSPFAVVMLILLYLQFNFDLPRMMHAITHFERSFYGNALGGGDGRMFVAFTPMEAASNYYLFSKTYWIQIINEHLLLSPVSIFVMMTIPLWLRNGMEMRKFFISDPVNIFLMIASVFQVLFSFIWNPDFGMQEDWTLFCSSSIGYTILIIRFFMHYHRPQYGARMKMILIIFAIFHIVPWIAFHTQHLTKAAYEIPAWEQFIMTPDNTVN